MAVTLEEERKLSDLEWERFRRMIIAVHPRESHELLKALDGESSSAEAEAEGFAKPLSEEELDAIAQDYVPMSEEDVSSILDGLRSFGFHMEE